MFIQIATCYFSLHNDLRNFTVEFSKNHAELSSFEKLSLLGEMAFKTTQEKATSLEKLSLPTIIGIVDGSLALFILCRQITKTIRKIFK